jgi:hypothetical protein
MSAALHIRMLSVDGDVVPGHVHGGVLVPPAKTNWLVHVTTTRQVPLAVGTDYVLRIDTREGITIEGAATLRRSDGKGHYFVGKHIPADLAGS